MCVQTRARENRRFDQLNKIHRKGVFFSGRLHKNYSNSVMREVRVGEDQKGVLRDFARYEIPYFMS